jgi:ankyrin repeat protein
MDEDKPKKKPLAVCATHGLNYDAATHSGCVLCRKAEQRAEPAPPSNARWYALAGAALVGVAVMVGVARRRHEQPQAAVATASLDQAAPLKANQPAAKQQAQEKPPGNPLPERAAKQPVGSYQDIFNAAGNNAGRDVQRLLASGVSIEQTLYRNGPTPLAWAVKHGHFELGEWLIREGANADREDVVRPAFENYTPLSFMQLVLERSTIASSIRVKVPFPGWDVSGANCTLLCLPVSRGDRRGAELLVQHGFDVHAKAGNNTTLLMLSLLAPSDRVGSMVQWLIDRGVDPNETTNDVPPVRPMDVALAKFKFDAVRVMLLNGVPFDRPKRDQYDTPLLAYMSEVGADDSATHPSRIQAIRFALSMGVDPRPAAEKLKQKCDCPRIGEDLIFAAAKQPHVVPPWAAVDDAGNTQLHWAAAFGEPGLVRKLFSEHPDLDRLSDGPGELSMRYDSSSTPLHLAAYYSQVEAARTLLQLGAKADVPDGKGRLPKDVAGHGYSSRADYDSRVRDQEEIKKLFR